MRIKLATIFTLTAVSLLYSIPASAHHGTATYDLSKTITLNGTVSGFDWGNPHCLIHVDATGENGKVAHWTLELASPFTMSRKGWTKESLKLRDQIAVETHPARNGLPLGITATSGYIMKVTVNGQALSSQ
jgi:hypothetical protein